ncbi:hypothetical protein [Luteimonas rhizosphaerae]|nr:hypothetical protein [Luteimonas sp. 4-12]
MHAGPAVVLGLLHHRGPDWIEFDVAVIEAARHTFDAQHPERGIHD